MNKIKIQEDTIYNKYAYHDIKIIHIADIHFNINIKNKKLISLSKCINLEKPDYIIITGDTIDTGEITNNYEKIQELISFFKCITNNNKVIISLGNHDIYNGYQSFFEELNKINNLFVLDNKAYTDEFVYIGGLTLPKDYYYNKNHDESVKIFIENIDKNSKLFNKLPSNKVKIALIHSPIKLTDSKVLAKLSSYDLILSGHTHDGMVPDFLKPLFKNNTGIISPYKKLFPKIARGKIVNKDKNITIIITGGVTKLSLKSAKSLSKLSFVYNTSVNRIIITKKRGINNE